ALLKNQVGWRASMLIIGLFLFVLALLMALLIRDKKTIRPPTSIYHLIRHSYSGLRQVISMPVIWINGLFIGFLYAPTQSFAELWGPSYLHTIYHLPMETAGGLTSLIFIGWAIGSPIAGWISDRIGRRKPILWASASLSLIIMSMILYLPHLSTSALGFLLFTYGLSNVGVATSYAVAAESSPEKREGTAMGFTNMASISVGAILQPMIGLLLDHAAGPVKHHSPAIYTAAHFHFAMSLLPLSFIICLISCCFLKESYPRQKKEK
ncbi:MAG: MFS transporter, partial [Alphaproteobacteria bacterium]|nr:MFS transporter [Alphaproteobacteria bacterium]